MTEFAPHFNGSGQLYPQIEPIERLMLDVGDGHQVYVETSGTPGGIPVLFLHGGPGGGCNPTMRRYFDPGLFRVILFDQRGCGRSRPQGCVDDNTSWHLVDDIEAIRNRLGISRWILFGGSWGAALALLYAGKHPERVAHLVLRGVFLMTRSELDWFYGGAAGWFRPTHWSRFVEPIPQDERGDLIAAYRKRLFSGDPDVEIRHARRWFAWESSMTTFVQKDEIPAGTDNYVRSFSRIESHYFSNYGFLEHDNFILANIERIRGIPGTIVQGRYDLVCPPQAACKLDECWPDSTLNLVQGGHSLSDPEISNALVRVMDALGRRLAPGWHG